MSAGSADALQRTLEREVAFRDFPGANAEVVCDGESLWRGAAGVLGPTSGEPLPPGSVFPIYSITKTFSAIATLRLAARGALTLDAPISRWLPDLPFSDRISLRQLLGHTAGVFNYSALPEYHDAVARTPGEPWSFEAFVDRTCHRPLDFEPGVGWSYSNTGYTLVKRILELATGESFRAVIRGEVSKPAGLEQTFALESANDMQSVAPGYSALFTPDMQGPPRDVRDVYHPGWCGTGVLASTTADVCQLFEALFAGRLLEKDSLDAMLDLTRVPGHHPPAVTPSYGLGIMGDPDATHGPEYGHGGGGPGWNLRAVLHPDLAGRRVTAAVFCNHDAEHANEIAAALIHEVAR